MQSVFWGYIREYRKSEKNSSYAVDSKAIPIAPHLLFPQFMDDDTERELALFMDTVLLGKREELWAFGEMVSEGMSAEIAKAKQKTRKSVILRKTARRQIKWN